MNKKTIIRYCVAIAILAALATLAAYIWKTQDRAPVTEDRPEQTDRNDKKEAENGQDPDEAKIEAYIAELTAMDRFTCDYESTTEHQETYDDGRQNIPIVIVHTISGQESYTPSLTVSHMTGADTQVEGDIDDETRDLYIQRYAISSDDIEKDSLYYAHYDDEQGIQDLYVRDLMTDGWGHERRYYDTANRSASQDKAEDAPLVICGGRWALSQNSIFLTGDDTATALSHDQNSIYSFTFDEDGHLRSIDETDYSSNAHTCYTISDRPVTGSIPPEVTDQAEEIENMDAYYTPDSPTEGPETDGP